MTEKTTRKALFPLFLFLLLLFSACSSSKVGTVPSGTPDHGNGTPAVVATSSSTSQPVLTAQPNTAGSSYAFVRQNQLWVALHNAKPAQVTNFDYSKLPEAFWHQPMWSPGDSFIAFIMNARSAGLGGGGCPGPDYGANGALYVMNTTTRQFTQVTLPSVAKNAQMNGTPRIDSWQYIFWENSTHLLAWYNSVPGKTGAGLYRYDVNAQTLTPVLPLSALGAATLFDPQKDMPLLLSLRYSNEQLFYQIVVHPFEQQSQVVIYRHSLTHPDAQSTKLTQMGSEPWCTTQQSGSFVRPGWDITPNGEQLVTQGIAANGPDQSVGMVQSLSLNDGSTTALFAQAPAELLGHDVMLTWGPDSQTVVATTYHMTSQNGPYTASLANPTAIQQYAPNLAGLVSWRPDSTAFVLQNTETMDTASASNVYVFLTGDTHGRMLLTDAHEFTWG